MSEMQYNTLGNGGIMYRVFDNTEKKVLRVMTPEQLLSENERRNIVPDEENEFEWGSTYKLSEIRIPYTRVWIGNDPENDWVGYEIIAEINCYEDVCSYVFIGPTVTFFWTPQPIELYNSYVGNSGVPYGFAATKDYVYGFTHTEDDQVIVVSRKRIEERLRKKTGKSLNDEITEEDMWEVTDEIMQLPFASVKQETLHDNFNANEYEQFDQKRFQEIMESTKQVARRRGNYGNTRVALGSRLPMNLAHHISEFRTGLAYRPYKKNTVRNNRVNTISAIGPLPNNTNSIGDNTNRNNSNTNSISGNTVPTASTRCKNGKCAIMGGRRKRTYKRRLEG